MDSDINKIRVEQKPKNTTSSIIIKFFVGFLIAMIVLGIILILFSDQASTVMLFGKIEATLAAIEGALLIDILNVKMLEKKESTVRILSSVSLGFSIVFVFFAVLLIWEIMPTVIYDNSHYYSYSSQLSTGASIMISSVSITVYCAFISLSASIKEYNSIIKILKITTCACLTYCGIVLTIQPFVHDYSGFFTRLILVSTVLSLGGGIAFIAELILAFSERKKLEREMLMRGFNASQNNVNIMPQSVAPIPEINNVQHETTTTVEQTTPTFKQEAPIVGQNTPTPEQGMPMPEQGMPTPEHGTPAFEQEAPIVEQNTPTLEQGTPAPTQEENNTLQSQ